MKNMTLEHIAEICGGIYCGAEDKKKTEVSSIVTDSRKAEKGSLFVPIVGARVDGHTFIPQVMEAGALATLTEQEMGEQPYPCIKVKSSLEAVKAIAEDYLKQINIPVVGITGSVGKTSTKEMIAAVLSQKFKVLKTLGNFNNELGLPLTVFRLREGDEIAVLEMGISDFGEMTRLSRIARPNVGVITNIGWCHLENLKTRDGIFKAKTEMFSYIKDGGSIILNGDDDKLSQVKEYNGIYPVFFGLDARFPVWADQIENLGLKGMHCLIHTPEEKMEVHIPLPGQHMVYNALAGTAVGRAFGMRLADICKGIESLQSLGGRFNILECRGMTVVDDCYNANPVSMKASLDVLQDGSGRRIAILGDMGELGEEEAALHAQVGAYAAECRIDILYTVGKLTEYLAEAACKGRKDLIAEHFSTVEELLAVLSQKVQKGDTILVKASHFMHFERIVQALQDK